MTTYCISGSRGITNGEDIKWYLDSFLLLTRHDDVIFGDASGVDALAKAYCIGHKLPFKVYPADWDKHGKAAGPIRNKQMVQGADIVIAFWDGESKGTRSTIHEALKAGKELHVYRVSSQSGQQSRSF